MRSVKVFVIGMITILSFLSILTIFLPSKITVSKSIFINAPEAEVTKEINSFDNWKQWYPAFRNHDISVTISQKNGSSFASLTDQKNRQLSMTMVQSAPENINILLSEENKNEVSYQFILMPGLHGQTQLTWNVNTILSWYPWKKIAGIFLDKIKGPQYEEILQNLKTAVENAHQNGLPK
jgi:hypothetical protein